MREQCSGVSRPTIKGRREAWGGGGAQSLVQPMRWSKASPVFLARYRTVGRLMLRWSIESVESVDARAESRFFRE